MALSALLWADSSFSDYTYGYSYNAAAGGFNWDMSESVLGVAPVPGMDVDNVIYRYTSVKNPADPLRVHVQNENAVDGGYIFRETDDWSGLLGATITKTVPVGYIPIKFWGPGSIETEGVGSVEDASVVYTYRLDPCINPQANPSCPGYIDPFNISGLYNPLDDDAVKAALEPTDPDLYDKDEDEEEKEPSEKRLAASKNALSIAAGMNQTAMLQAMNAATNMNTYYAASIPGGTYQETVILVDTNLPDNRRAFRSMANDKLHSEMVNDQYGR